MSAASEQPVTMPGPISAGQRKAIFAAAHARGMSIDDIRDMTPAGSISKLTAAEASRVLDSINAGTQHELPRRKRPRGPRRPKGSIRLATPDQHRFIAALRIELGWTEGELDEFLSKRTFKHGGPMDKIQTTADGIEVIELLKGVRDRQQAADRKRFDWPSEA